MLSTVIFFPSMMAAEPWNPARLPSSLAWFTSGHSLFRASLARCVKSSVILIVFCLRISERFASAQMRSRCVREVNCTIMRRGWVSPFFPSLWATSMEDWRTSARHGETKRNISITAIFTFSPSTSGIPAIRRFHRLLYAPIHPAFPRVACFQSLVT